MVLYKLLCTASILASITCVAVSSQASMAPRTHKFTAPIGTTPLQVLQTSDYWYRHPAKDDFFPNSIITDADGWRDLRNPQHFWYHHKITRAEFSNRAARSTTLFDSNYRPANKPAPF